MKKMIFAFAITSIFAPAAFAQTPQPNRTSAAAPAPSASTGAPTGGTGAEGKLAYINQGRFSGDINELRAKLDAFNTELDPKRKEVQAEEEALNNLKNKINTQGATVSAQVRSQWVEEASDKEKALTRKKEDYNLLGQRRLAEVAQPVYDKVTKYLDTYCQQRGIVMVLEVGAAQQAGILIFASQGTDITEDFIKEYNKTNPSAAGAATAPPKKP